MSQMVSPSHTGPSPRIEVGERALAVAVGMPVEAVRLRVVGGGLKVELAPGRSLRVDGEGRWITARIGPWVLRRRVDGGIVFSRRGGAGPGGEIATQDAAPDSHWHRVVGTLAAALRARILRLDARGEVADKTIGTVEVEGDRHITLAWADSLLKRVASLGPADYQALHEAFQAAYAEPVPILPPDRYRDLVILPAVGCPHAECTFCAWYHDSTFRAFDAATLEEHLKRVAALFGEGLSARDGLFLGSASAFSVADARLLSLLSRLEAIFGRQRRGVAGFLEPDHAPERGRGDWARLGEAGVTRVVLGLETAHPPMRSRLGKSADLSRFTSTVLALKSAGLSCGITVLAGAARPDEIEAHHARTSEYLEMLSLGPEDLVYLSPWDRALDRAAAAREAASLKEAIGRVTPAKRSAYALDRYRYYA